MLAFLPFPVPWPINTFHRPLCNNISHILVLFSKWPRDPPLELQMIHWVWGAVFLSLFLSWYLCLVSVSRHIATYLPQNVQHTVYTVYCLNLFWWVEHRYEQCIVCIEFGSPVWILNEKEIDNRTRMSCYYKEENVLERKQAQKVITSLHKCGNRRSNTHTARPPPAHYLVPRTPPYSAPRSPLHRWNEANIGWQN